MEIICEFHINAQHKEQWGNNVVNMVDSIPTKLKEECLAYPFEIGVIETPNDPMFSYILGVYLFTLSGKQVFVKASDILPMSPEYGDFENYVSALIDYLKQHDTIKP